MISPSSRIIHPFFIRWNKAHVCCSFCFSLTYRPPVQKKKKRKKSWTHEFYECCSHRIAATNSQQLKLSASIEQWPELAIISSHTPPPIFYFPLFVSFVQGEWNACERGQKLEWGGILFFFFFNSCRWAIFKSLIIVKVIRMFFVIPL